MPADRRNLTNLAMAGTVGLFHFNPARPGVPGSDFMLDEITAPGFFDACATLLRPRDIIQVAFLSGVVPLVVANVHQKAVTVVASPIFALAEPPAVAAAA